VVRKRCPTCADEKGDDARMERVKALVEPLLFRLGVAQQYSVRICFLAALKSEKNALPNGGPRIIAARVSEDYPYRVMLIELNRAFFDNSSDYDVVRTVVHEILHITPFGPLHRYAGKLLGKPPQEDEMWLCEEEESVDLLALWISRLWVDYKEKVDEATPPPPARSLKRKS